MRIVRPIRLLRWFYPGTFWRGNRTVRTVYLTFDDGPIPEVTPWVLDILKQYNIKATFFCVGNNVEKYPQVFNRLIKEGHLVGNHTYNHINIWKQGTKDYYSGIQKFQKLYCATLFRPPHGKLYPWNVWRLKKMFKKIVMWDVLTYDFEKNISSDEVLKNITQNVRNGSVIVFHDSTKAWGHLNKVLPLSIEWLIKNKYHFKLIEN
ncbi:MAG: polysaccharide deacetylase family protein [Marinilabiliaceae bacterium]|nr:polysaccharide deacetylase family protein [Marinilabiliaceae bacterium]